MKSTLGRNYRISIFKEYSPRSFFYLAVNKQITNKTLNIFIFWLLKILVSWNIKFIFSESRIGMFNRIIKHWVNTYKMELVICIRNPAHTHTHTHTHTHSMFSYLPTTSAFDTWSFYHGGSMHKTTYERPSPKCLVPLAFSGAKL